MTTSQTSKRLFLFILLLYLAVFSYHTLRYDGRSIDGDEVGFTRTIDVLQNAQRIPSNDIEEAYSSGYGYQSVIVFVSELSGIDARTLQELSRFWLLPFAFMLLVFYRQATGDVRIALLSLVLLLLIPDAMYYLLRNTHEKGTWTYLVLMGYIWIKSYKYSKNPAVFIPLVFTFYLLYFGMAATHVFFSTTIVVTFLLSLLFSWMITLLPTDFASKKLDRESIQRVGVIFVATFLILYLMVTQIYSPSQSYFRGLELATDRISLLFFGGDPNIAARVALPTNFVTTGAIWRGTATYLMITGAQWVIVFTAVYALLRVIFRFIRGRASTEALLYSLLFASFAAQVVISFIVDFLGINNFSNLQLRIFVPTGIVAAPLAAMTLYMLITRIKKRFARLTVTSLVFVGIFLGFVGSVLKFTNDPLVANRYTFFNTQDVAMLSWTNDNISDSTVWVDTWPHMGAVLTYHALDETEQYSNEYTYSGTFRSESIRYIAVSDRVMTSMTEQGLPTYSAETLNRFPIIYDTGGTSVYKRPAETPYQP